VNDNPKNNIEGKLKNINLNELRLLCSLGKSNEKQKNAEGITPDVAKLILPQKTFHRGSLKK
jgi:hypothetical protein